MKRLCQNRKPLLRRALIFHSTLAIVCFLMNSASPVLPRQIAESRVDTQTAVSASSARFDAIAPREQKISLKLTNTQRAQVNHATAAQCWTSLFHVEGHSLPFPHSGAGDYAASTAHPANRAPPMLTA